MNKNVVSQGLESYVILEAGAGEDYEYRMLFSNEIPCLLPVRIDVMNQKGDLIYHMTGCRTLYEVFEKKRISHGELRKIMEEILGGIQCIKKYLLVPDSLSLLPDAIYFGKEQEGLRFIYAPGVRNELGGQMRTLMEYLMSRMDPQDVGGVVLAWKLYMILKEERWSLEEIGQCIAEGGEETEERKLPFVKKNSPCFSALYRKKIRGKREGSFYALLLLLGILFILILASGVLLIHIYRYGILEWKRNGMIVLAFLLTAVVILLQKLIRGRKKEKILEDLFRLK